MFRMQHRTDESVQVVFVHGKFHEDFDGICEKYAWCLRNNFPRRIDGICVGYSMPSLQHVEKFTKPDAGKTFVVFEDRYQYELIRATLVWLEGCFRIPVIEL